MIGMHEEWASVNSSTIGPCITIPAYHPVFITVQQVFVSVTTVLSMLGAVLITGTFVAFKKLRTRARQILVQLSVADFGVAASQLVGVNVNLRKYAGHICSQVAEDDYNFTSDTLCQVQGGFTIFFTVSSYCWTIAVAVYLLTVIVFESQRVGKWMMYAFYPLCWGVPAAVVLVFGLRKAIGFHANVDADWCFVRNLVPHQSITTSEVLSQVFVYMTYLTLLVLYVWIRCSIRCKIRRISNKASLSYKLRLRAKNADLKLTFIPLIFIFLRIWGTILGVAHIYMGENSRAKFRETKTNAAFVFLSAVGSSAQGLTNALLFCLFTSMVRKRLTSLIRRRLCCRKEEAGVYLLANYSSNRTYQEDTTAQSDEEEVAVRSEAVVDSAGSKPTPHWDVSHVFPESLENSKYHSISVGKRVTVGTE